MADAIRVTNGSEWCYVPVGGKGYAKVARLASTGKAEANSAEVRLMSESGPLDWDEIRQSEGNAAPLAALAALIPDGILVSPGEKVCFGKQKNSVSYNDFADLSLLRGGPSHGLALASGTLVDGDLVLTVWPSDGRLIPARVSAAGMRLSVELAEPIKRDARCFVVDEHGKSLLTASMRSDGSPVVGILPPMAVDSWLFSAGSGAAKLQADKFSITASGRTFIIRDNRHGSKYAGRFKNDPATSPERYNLENERVAWLLSSRGLSGILPNYQLTKATPW